MECLVLCCKDSPLPALLACCPQGCVVSLMWCIVESSWLCRAIMASCRMLVPANPAALLLVLQRVVEEMEGPQGAVSNNLHGGFPPSASDGEVFAAPDNLHIAIPHLQSTLAGELGIICLP